MKVMFYAGLLTVSAATMFYGGCLISGAGLVACMAVLFPVITVSGIKCGILELK